MALPSSTHPHPRHYPRFIFTIRALILAETNLIKRRLLWQLSLALGAYLFLLPFGEFIGGVSPAYVRTRVVTGFDRFLTTTVFYVLVWLLSPFHAAEAFKVRSGAGDVRSMQAESAWNECRPHGLPARPGAQTLPQPPPP